MLRNLQNQIFDYLSKDSQEESVQEGFDNTTPGDIATIAKKQNDELDATYSTNQSRIDYQQQLNKTAKLANYWLYWVYAILALIFIFFLFRGPKAKEIEWKYKSLYILLIIAFPYVIVPIELILKKLVVMIYYTTIGKPYEESKWKVMGETDFQTKYNIDTTLEDEERMKNNLL